MNDKEIQRAILEFAFDHQHEHQLRIVEIKDIEAIKNVDPTRLLHDLIYLKKEGLVENIDDMYSLIRLTNNGINLVDNKALLDELFPLIITVPDETKKLVLSVETVLQGKYDSILEQFRKAQKFLYHTKPSDKLNSVKEAVGAVEALAKVLLNQPSSTLGQLARSLTSNHMNHPAMEKIIDGIYGVACDVPGARHGAYRKTDFSASDAEFILNVSASIILYLLKDE
jgi:hypothetical protein